MGRRGVLMMLIAASVLSQLLTEAYEEDGVIHVGGKVMCQDCSKDWYHWIHGSRPIKGAVVSLTCMDERGRTLHYGSDETDELGQYNMIVNKKINGKVLKPEFCLVRLVSSPDRTCNVLTNFAGGRSGVKLLRPTMVYRDLVKFLLGEFFCTSPMCADPETDSDDGK